MKNSNDERKFKVERILEEYEKRKTQKEVAEMLKMEIQDVSWVTQENNYKHTRKITPENRREGEKISPAIVFERFDFLDKYPMENFQK